MKFLAWMLVIFSFSIGAESSHKDLIGKARELFNQGKYQSTISELDEIEKKLILQGESNKSVLGLIFYWKGICHNRLQEFPEAIAGFDKALGFNYSPQDIHYEYGQSLFAAEKLKEARLQFRESLKRKFKRGVSLYYIAFISKELGERKKAYTFFKSIEKLEPHEIAEVHQAAAMQIADIYLEQAEEHPDVFRTVEQTVIPQYKKARDVNPDSKLAQQISQKITMLQRKYDLILFNLSNGRPALNPPYFLRLAIETGRDTNVTFAPAETTISESKQASLYSKVDVIGRYTFYYRDFLSIAPEFRFNRTHYFNREPEIYRNDNMLLAPAVRTAYEHTLWKKPASVLFDYDYNESRRDVNAKEELEFSSRSHTLMIGERFNYWDSGESIIRLRYRMMDSFLGGSDSKLTSLVFEQIKNLKENTLLFYFSYDRMRVENDVFDTDSFTLRGDLVFSRVKDWFTPSLGLALTSTDPINDRATRGREMLFNPSVRLAKTFKKNWRGNLRYDYQKNSSKDKTRFAYKKSIYAFELEYLF